MASSIQVEHLSKRYRINHQQDDGRPWWTTLARAATTPVRGLVQGAALGSVEDFWAVRDISFSVNQGEVVGIIGRNGAGKSTLLKILTRITEPTSGSATIRGRVGSLLEVGTGFHPELSGRDNVYLNASILGMSHREIKSKFDEIVEFSGVEKFLDTPVKRYSSGMKVRLAFAVAAHLDLEILLIDEVLAVGDADFQNRCLGKMSDVARAGRTVLFVSHNMVAVENLCSRTLVLQDGRVVDSGDTDDVITRYLLGFKATKGERSLVGSDAHREGTGEVRVQSVKILSETTEVASVVPMGKGMRVQLEVLAHEAIDQVSTVILVKNQHGGLLSCLSSWDTRNMKFDFSKEDRAIIDCHIPTMNLMPGVYALDVAIRKMRHIDYVHRTIEFEVAPADVYGTGRTPFAESQVFLDANWQLVRST